MSLEPLGIVYNIIYNPLICRVGNSHSLPCVQAVSQRSQNRMSTYNEHESAIGYKWHHTEWYTSHFQHIKSVAFFVPKVKQNQFWHLLLYDFVLFSNEEKYLKVFYWRHVSNIRHFFMSTLWVAHTNCCIVLKVSVKMCWKSCILILYWTAKIVCLIVCKKSIIYSERKDTKY